MNLRFITAQVVYYIKLEKNEGKVQHINIYSVHHAHVFILRFLSDVVKCGASFILLGCVEILMFS